MSIRTTIESMDRSPNWYNFNFESGFAPIRQQRISAKNKVTYTSMVKTKVKSTFTGLVNEIKLFIKRLKEAINVLFNKKLQTEKERESRLNDLRIETNFINYMNSIDNNTPRRYRTFNSLLQQSPPELQNDMRWRTETPLPAGLQLHSDGMLTGTPILPNTSRQDRQLLNLDQDGDIATYSINNASNFTTTTLPSLLANINNSNLQLRLNPNAFEGIHASNIHIEETNSPGLFNIKIDDSKKEELTTPPADDSIEPIRLFRTLRRVTGGS